MPRTWWGVSAALATVLAASPAAAESFTAEKGGADQWSHLRVSVDRVFDFTTKDRPGWRDNGTHFSAKTRGKEAVTIQVDVTGKGGVSYFDYNVTVSLQARGSGKVLFSRQEKISKDGGQFSCSYSWDPKETVNGLGLEVRAVGGNPDTFQNFVSGAILVEGSYGDGTGMPATPQVPFHGYQEPETPEAAEPSSSSSGSSGGLDMETVGALAAAAVVILGVLIKAGSGGKPVPPPRPTPPPPAPPAAPPKKQHSAQERRAAAERMKDLEKAQQEAAGQLHSARSLTADTLTNATKEVWDTGKAAATGAADLAHQGAVATRDAVVDVVRNPEILAQTIRDSWTDVKTGADKAAELGKQAGKELAEAGRDVWRSPEIISQTLRGTAKDASELVVKTGTTIYEHARDPEKRMEFIKYASGYNNFTHSWDPNTPLAERLAYVALGVMKIYSAGAAAQAGTVRAVGVTAIKTMAGHGAVQEAEGMLEQARKLEATCKMLGINLRTSASPEDMLRTYTALKGAGLL